MARSWITLNNLNARRVLASFGIAASLAFGVGALVSYPSADLNDPDPSRPIETPAANGEACVPDKPNACVAEHECTAVVDDYQCALKVRPAQVAVATARTASGALEGVYVGKLLRFDDVSLESSKPICTRKACMNIESGTVNDCCNRCSSRVFLQGFSPIGLILPNGENPSCSSGPCDADSGCPDWLGRHRRVVGTLTHGGLRMSVLPR
jgi:hypothetical protein